MSLFRRYVLHNLHLKLAALGLSALLWSAIANEPRDVKVLESPLEFRNMPQNLELGTEVPTAVQVRISGPASTLRDVTSADLGIVLDFSGFDQPGERSFTLRRSDLQIPFGVQVMQIIPAQVRVHFEARSRRSVPVTPRIVGTFASGYYLGSYAIEPSAVSVVGPESHVAALESVSTDPVDISGAIARSQFWTNAFVPDPLVRIQSAQAIRVTVHMKRR